MATKYAYVRSRVSPKVKKQAEKIIGQLGLDTSSYIRMCLHQLIHDKAVPFQVHLGDERSEVEDIGMSEAKRMEVLDYLDE